MTAYLAFDRDRVEGLRAALLRTLDELSRLIPGDPAAVGPRDALRLAVDRMEPWLARLRTIADAGALTDLFTLGSPLGSSGPDSAGYRGLTVIPDRGPVTTAAEVALIGAQNAAALVALDPDGLDLAAYVAELAARFGTDRPAVTAATLAALGPERFAALLAELSDRVRGTRNGVRLARPEIVATTDLLTGLGPGYARVLAADPASWAGFRQTVDPFLAATLFAGAAPGLGAHTATRLGTDLLRRAADDQGTDPLWRDTAAAALHGLAAVPEAARAALLEWSDAELDLALFRVDPALAGALLRSGTSPEWHDPAAVEHPLFRVIEALAARGRREGHPRFAEPTELSDPLDPLDPSRWWIDVPSGVAWPIPAAVLPIGIGAVIAPWLPHLVGPDHEVGWRAANGAPEPWPALEPDALTTALTVPMQHEADAAALRLEAHRFFAASLTGAPATQQHAAYLLGAVEDAGRHAGYTTLAERQAAAEGWAGLADLGLNAAPTWVATPLGWGAARLSSATVPDLRHELATAEAAGVGVAVSAAALAVSDWRTRHAPEAPPLPALPTDDGADPNDRADDHARRVAVVIEDWADALDPAARAEVAELYNRVYSAALAGTAFVA